MKLENKTDLPTWAIRRAIAFGAGRGVLEKVGIEIRYGRKERRALAVFRPGLIGRKQFRVLIPRDDSPWKWAVEAGIVIAATLANRPENTRPMREFLAAQGQLVLEWCIPPARVPRPTQPENAAETKLRAAEAALARWRRVEKLAKTKIRKYARRVKYYCDKTKTADTK